METTPKAFNSLREAIRGETVLHTEARPIGPSRLTPEKVIDAVEMFGLEAARLAIQSCFGENNDEAQAALKSRFIDSSQPSLEVA